MIEKDRKRADGKSITDILALAVTSGSYITIEARGIDSERAVKELEKLVTERFGEE